MNRIIQLDYNPNLNRVAQYLLEKSPLSVQEKYKRQQRERGRVTIGYPQYHVNFAPVAFYQYIPYDQMMQEALGVAPLRVTNQEGVLIQRRNTLLMPIRMWVGQQELILTEEQYKAACLFLCGECWNMSLGGKAGTGKSVVLRYIISNLQNYYTNVDVAQYERNRYMFERERRTLNTRNNNQNVGNNRPSVVEDNTSSSSSTNNYTKRVEKLRKPEFFWKSRVAVTGSTGVAATNINGVTLHSLFSMSGQESNYRAVLRRFGRWGSFKRMTLESLEVLLIDEASMIPAEMFNILDIVSRTVRVWEDLPFGGLRLLLVEDFGQLGPIVSRNWQQRDEKVYVFESEAWANAIGDNTMMLSQSQRQLQGEAYFLDFLDKMRSGELTAQEKQDFLLKTLWKIPNKQKYLTNIKPKYLTNEMTVVQNSKVEVEEVNLLKVVSLGRQGNMYEAEDSGTWPEGKECPYPLKLPLEIGCKVMLRKNLAVTNHLVNGSIGYVTGFHEQDKYPLVYFPLPNAPLVDYPEPISGAENPYASIYAYSKFLQETFPNRIFHITPDLFVLDQENLNLAARLQLPMDLYYSSTVDKTQGQTLDSVLISPHNMKRAGQLYTAFSRVRRLQDVRVFSEEMAKFLNQVLERMPTQQQQSIEMILSYINPLRLRELSDKLLEVKIYKPAIEFEKNALQVSRVLIQRL